MTHTRSREWAHGFAALAGSLACLACNEGVGSPVQEHKQYQLHTDFDVSGAIAGQSSLGRGLRALDDFADEPGDPGKFVVQAVIDQLPVPLNEVAKPLRGELGPLVNEGLLYAAPDLVDQAKGFDQGMASIIRVFSVESLLDVGLDSEGRYTASHRLERIVISFGGNTVAIEGRELGPLLVPSRIPVTISHGTMTIGTHALPLPLGSVLAKATNRLVVPAVAPGGPADYVEMVDNWLSCDSVSTTIAQKCGIADSDQPVFTACQEASRALSAQLTRMFAELDRSGRLVLQGTATVCAAGGHLDWGSWTGDFQFGDAAVVRFASGDAKFVGFQQ